MTRIVAFMPAKGSSERLKNKNLQILDGEYLFKHKLRQLLDCPEIDEVYLDTEDDYIAELASDLDIQRLQRPEAFASNATDGHELFKWQCSQVEADIYIQALCTAPFVTSETVGRAIGELTAAPDADSLVAVTRQKQYLWKNGQPTYGHGRIPNSVDLPDTVVEAMSLYMVKNKGGDITKRFGSNPLLFELSPYETIDVNWKPDLELAETIAAGVRAKEQLALNSLVPFLTSAMLSDIGRELQLQVNLPKEISGAPGKKIIGRAKTLLLEELQPNEDWQGIYDALDSYEFVRPGDVIVVQNTLQGQAYFGNLNAQLAMRAGAVGAVISSMTRDKTAVRELGFPVYSRGHYCKDVKYDGTTRAMNHPIEIGGIAVKNGDYVLADEDGVVVVPAESWDSVLEEAMRTIEKEWQIGQRVALGQDAKSIVKDIGEF